MLKEYQIVIFIPSIENGGVEKNLELISNYLAKKKEINLSIVTAFQNNNFIFTKKIKFYTFNSKFKKIFNTRFFRTALASLLLLRLCFKKKTIIFSFQSNIVAIIFAKIFNKKIIIRLNTSPEKYINNFFKKKFYRFFYSLSDLIIINSKNFKKKIYSLISNNLFKKNILHIYNPCLKIKPKKIMFNFFKKDELKIINIGRLTDQKDQITLLKSFKKLIKIRPAKLLIIGNGNERKKIKNFIIENNLDNFVKLMNYKKNAIDYLNISDVFVLSSKYEGLPNVLIECLYLKKYIISTNCDTGPKEILYNGKIGTLFQVGNDKQLFKILLKINLNSNLLSNKILKAYKSFDRFDYIKNSEKYYKSISDLIKN